MESPGINFDVTGLIVTNQFDSLRRSNFVPTIVPKFGCLVVNVLKNGPFPGLFLLIFVYLNKHYNFYNKYM